MARSAASLLAVVLALVWAGTGCADLHLSSSKDVDDFEILGLGSPALRRLMQRSLFTRRCFRSMQYAPFQLCRRERLSMPALVYVHSAFMGGTGVFITLT